MGNSETENNGYVRIVGDTREGVSVEVHEESPLTMCVLLANIIRGTRKSLISAGVREELASQAIFAAFALDKHDDDDADDKETED